MENHSQSSVTRRAVLKAGAGCAVGGMIAPATLSAGAPTTLPVLDVYAALGVKRVINAAGTLTILGGSLMPPEVVAAWAEAATSFVNLYELEQKVSNRIAELLDVEAALVTTGASGAMLLATAAAVSRGDQKLIRSLPNDPGPRNEVITQTTHHACYDHQITNCGVKLVDVETRDDLERAINEHTAMMLFYNLYEDDGKIGRQEWVEVARKHNVPTLLDAAADVPPLDALWRYNKMGFDMVAFSGGKALMGPNDTGLLLGRKDLIEAARLNSAPRCNNIGRMMKVSKEDMVAMWAALERYVHADHAAEWREWQRRIGVIEAAVKSVPTVTTERMVPPIANHVPHLVIFWDEDRVRLTGPKIKQLLIEGDPAIAIGRVRGTGDRGLLISVFMLKDGEDEVVANRLRQIFSDAVA